LKKTKSFLDIGGNKNLVTYNKIYNTDWAITLNGGKNNKLSYNTVYKSYTGFVIYGSKNSLYKNKVYRCEWGITYEDKTNKLLKNIFKKNKHNIDFTENGPIP
jgi:parallel beta-helix repeat protein